MEPICADFAAEADDLDAIVSADGVDLRTPTPAPGWSVRDQISHLRYFDRCALLALVDPEAFAAEAERLIASGDTQHSVEAGLRMDPADLLMSWRVDRQLLIDEARTRDPAERVPWYGPPMSARSFVTARLMETWAHGQDIVDALGVHRQPTDRLRHVAHIGVRARPFSYFVHGREMPDVEIRVELVGPRGDAWEWGPEGAADRVTGTALDFCLVVTQRRHPDDVGLDITGEAAAEWISIAQAFAGPAGAGRRPGQFA
jgi:uncharacterized protein (TIGR03084 family)